MEMQGSRWPCHSWFGEWHPAISFYFYSYLWKLAVHSFRPGYMTCWWLWNHVFAVSDETKESCSLWFRTASKCRGPGKNSLLFLTFRCGCSPELLLSHFFSRSAFSLEDHFQPWGCKDSLNTNNSQVCVQLSCFSCAPGFLLDISSWRFHVLFNMPQVQIWTQRLLLQTCFYAF